MKYMTVNQKVGPEPCFIVKEGTHATVVIPYSTLTKVDYKRLQEIEAKGGEMMRAMLDATLSNGRNALAMYSPLLRTVHHPPVNSVHKDGDDVKMHNLSLEKELNDNEKIAPETPKKRRGRGRPPKNKK